ncbi:hypothetical protein CLCR_09758 [Cladophialophora carrionii]|uniref:Polynucleotide 5'-hydroxyl-kinase GRC3 n=1 Tax=Cladophialophora carrionii TaxID=86049 RepID=A0A1C1CX96_9EURO|nr:hypothetical protein CLCR_09758 [Cladophialophora carrionii]
MQANGHRLSAVARRRLLQTSVSAGSKSSRLSPAEPVDAEQKGVTAKADSTKHDDSTSQDDGIEVANQFSTLVEASAVGFSSSREVEQLPGNSFRIRLSRGQKCVVLGTCVLWVKQGSVFIYGAVLSASPTTYRIYAPSTHALPSIEAMTSLAELQLDPLSDGINDLPIAGTGVQWAPPGVKHCASPFYVLGHSFELDLKAPRRLRELNTDPWRALLANVVDYDTASPPRVLICGRRSSGLSTLVRCITNRLLAKQVTSFKSAHMTGVTLVDLDTITPEFAPPGVISLVHVRDLVFGPPFTHIMPPSRADTDPVLKQHFLGDINALDLADWHLARVYDLLDHERDSQPRWKTAPVVIVLPKWLNDVNPSIASKLWNKMSPTQIVCLDPSPTSPHLEPWRLLAGRDNCAIYQMPVQVFDRIPAVREHNLQLQSYFHLEDSHTSRQFWSETPILAKTSRTATLSYRGDGGMVYVIILLGGHVALQDTYEAVDGSLVALVAVPKPETPVNEDIGLNTDTLGDTLQSGEVRRTEEDLPRWREHAGVENFFPFRAQHSFCLGLAIVQEIDVANREITLITGPGVHVDDIQRQGYRVALVVPKATADGRFRTEWAHREMGMSNRRSQWNRTRPAITIDARGLIADIGELTTQSS